MYQHYYAGKFGNMLLSWPSLDAYDASDFEGLVVLRYKGQAGGAWCEYGVSREEVPSVVAKWISEGAKRELIVLNEFAKDDDLILQGEVMQSQHGLSLRYSRLPLPMRKALAKEQFHADGLRAISLLKTAMDPSSYDWLQELLDLYPGAVIEFSVWNQDVGNIPRRNTVIWEVRHY